MYEFKLGLKRAELNEHMSDCVKAQKKICSSGRLVYCSISSQIEGSLNIPAIKKKSDRNHWYEMTHNTFKCMNCTQILESSTQKNYILYCGCGCSVAKSYLILCNPMECSQNFLSFTLSLSLLEFMSIESKCCHPTISYSVAPSPPAVNLSQHQGFF